MHTIYHTSPCISPQSISALRLILVSQADTWCNMKKVALFSIYTMEPNSLQHV